LRFDTDCSVNFVHRLHFTRDVFSPDNMELADAIQRGGHFPARVFPMIDSGVLESWPDLPGKIRAYAQAHSELIELIQPVLPIQGGEDCKNDQQLQYRLCRAMDEAALCRQSFVLAIGGGAVLDSVGFAASIFHRGVRLIRMPTTTLSQDDSGVGVKNGINAFNKKNLLGTFCVPWAVICDEKFLTTLSDRDWRSGFIEAVKVGLIRDPALFEQIVDKADDIVKRDLAAAMPVIQRSAELHLKHITEGSAGGAADPFESTTARPLDFGHWAAHKLESLTCFEMRHGEAVAIGIALDVIYSHLVGKLDEPTMNEILDCLSALGYTLYHDAMRDQKKLFQGLTEFREHLGGQLTITLLESIGKGVDVHEIDLSLMGQALEQLAVEAARRS
jgi:3-dehydroquinate synthase